MRSIDYVGGDNESFKDSVGLRGVSANRKRGSLVGASRKKIDTSNTIVHDPDLVNFSPSQAEFKLASLDDFITISQPTQGFGKILGKAQAGAATQSIDRSS